MISRADSGIQVHSREGESGHKSLPIHRFWTSPWFICAVLGALDIVTTIIGLTLFDSRELNVMAKVLGGVSVFLGVKGLVMAGLCIRWAKKGDNYFNLRDKIVVYGILGAVVLWNSGVIIWQILVR